ncbi:serine hydrolase domain-containing protein [Planctomicrobium sp. SH664]|uniref:serine hydrolase domain-containing protein n=1 Tax=Planctomicrobium sp. SH664 TaxID=3448125 RepID=UPI003F5B0462
MSVAVIMLSLFLTARPARAEQENQSPRIAAIDDLITEGLQLGKMPGAVVLIGKGDEILHFQAYGNRQVLPVKEAMTQDTVFDLASLTKPLATATAVMVLLDRQQLDPEQLVCKFLPEFGNQGKEQIAVHHLLTHTSGLLADNALRDYQSGPEEAWKNICQLPLTAPVGEKFIYSDVGFIVLGRLVEAIAGKPLNEFVAEEVYRPLQMTETGYLPREEFLPRIAPTSASPTTSLRGVVHDPRARLLGGVAGHAGLFSTAADLSRYARMVLKQGELEGQRVLQPQTVQAMLMSRPVPGPGVRTWGWDRQTGYSGNRGDGMSDQALGHGGFTGTGLWIDPELQLYVIFLSNRVHPDGKGNVNSLIGKVGTAAVQSLPDRRSLEDLRGD